MRSRIILLVGTFLVLLLAFSIYYVASPRLRELPDEYYPVPAGAPRPGGRSREILRKAEGIVYKVWDEDGRLRAIYRLPGWDKQDDGSYLMTDPSFELRQRDGQRVYIRADSGRAYAEETAKGVNLRRGSLSGSVRIVLDRFTGGDRRPWTERPEDTVRIFVGDLAFDNELLEIDTDTRVVVFSPEADIYGRGLSIRWNEAPRELRMLRIEHGESMTIYRTEDLEAISLPGSGAAPRPGTRSRRTIPAAERAAARAEARWRPRRSLTHPMPALPPMRKNPAMPRMIAATAMP